MMNSRRGTLGAQGSSSSVASQSQQRRTSLPSAAAPAGQSRDFRFASFSSSFKALFWAVLNLLLNFFHVANLFFRPLSMATVECFAPYEFQVHTSEINVSCVYVCVFVGG